MKEKANNTVVSVFSRYCGYSLEKWVLKEASGPVGFFGVNFCGGVTASLFGIVSLLYAEFWSILVGLHLACSMGVFRLQLQSDSSVVIRMVLDPMIMTSLSPLVRTIALLSDHDWSIDFTWVPREHNITADIMFKLLPPPNYYLATFDAVFEIIQPLFVCDKDSLFYCRRSSIGRKFAAFLPLEKLLHDENLAMTVPEWYIDNGEGSNGQTSVVIVFEFQLHVQIAPFVGIGRPSSHSWDPNFPGICYKTCNVVGL
ncbi:hypothetical protein V6N12_003836 [Hibiscus sabdariffa]|uniref:RNase H type-1 domain-containing protein n=1 Tax=Hibiscus sabdariffa TaxID=183260 RepID=A0ABR2CJP5_9ROSI